ncbi:hypothetical protein [Agromyces sp. LHK192]|uniref:hypothetical protein n=1 Tax=Agromyces sp. LHK192 TaxID=2498704 RepID=UPI0013E36EF9|nr:hypothetical protein [Agromyces sp. LHK192]
MSLPSFRRSTVAISVAAGAWIGLGSLLIQPAIPEDPSEYVGVLANSPGAAVGIQLFVASQVFWAIGLVGFGHLAARRSRVLATFGAALSGLGAFGHAVYGGALLLQLALAGSDPDAAASALAVGESTVFVPYLVLGLAGTVLGLVLLAVAAIRARIAPLWVPIALLAWVVVEFVLPNFVAWSSYLSLVVGVVVFGALAVAVWRSGLDDWRTEAESGATEPAVSDVEASAVGR